MQRLWMDEGPPSGRLFVRPSRSILGAEFGRLELRHMAGAGLALSLIFAAALAGGAPAMAAGTFVAAFTLLLPMATAAALPPFFLSHLAQKRVARANGCTTDFRAVPQYLFISVLFALLFGFVFAAPGVTQRFGPLTRKGVLRMAAAVPLTFIAVAATGLLALLAVRGAAGPYLAALLATVATVNATMAVFALFPAPGLPGYDLWRTSRSTMVVLGACAVALFVALALAPVR